MKSLFVPMVLGRFERAATEAAIALAARHGASVDVLVGLGRIAPPAGDADCFPPRLFDMLRDSAKAASQVIAAAAMQTLSDVRYTVRVAGAFWPAPSDLALSGAVMADLVVLNRPKEAFGADDQLFASMLLGSGRPVMVVPESAGKQSGFRHVLIAWRPGREAARAVHDAIPLLQRAQSVRVVHVPGGGEATYDTDGADRALVDHLERHGLRPGFACLRRHGASKGESILDAARAMPTDLIVAGGYGHRKAYEHVFGGVTRTLLHGSHVPVLFSH